ncbi:MAG: phytanoyl-CoA dioxygenase family protein [Phycisphaeraceae bacterium]|nr:phytanoyl-CoA dioxygenase family protein [Phycisphaeraceae bacterium]
MGVRTLTYPSDQLGDLRDCNGLLDDIPALHQRMAEDGYLLIRGLIDRDKVLQARQTILDYMAQRGALVEGEPVLEGVMPKSGRTVPMMGRRGITHHEDLRAVFEGDELFEFFRGYFTEPAVTFDYKWLRGVGNEQFTGAHYDIVYMGRGSQRLHTCWIPFDDLPVEKGTLAMCVGSHVDPGFEKLRQTYGRMDVDRDRVQGWFSEDPLEITDKFGGRWQTTSFQAGDVMIFGMYTMHASTTNVTDRYRLSADVRFQPASDPVDPRWMGLEPAGHAAGSQPEKPIAEARAEWRV